MAETASMRWQDLSGPQVAALASPATVVVMPVAAIEQHGPHLPVSVDTVLVEGVVARVAGLLDALLPPAAKVLFLPTQCVGKSDEHARFAGTLTLSGETLSRVWNEIGDSVAAAGMKKLLVLNSHGGQPSVMADVARSLRARHGMLVVPCNWWDLGMPDGLFSQDERTWGIHAGDIETSMMLALAPHLVRMDLARDFRALGQEIEADYPLLASGDGVRFGWQTQDLNAQGACGNATLATAAKGNAVLDHVATRIAALIAETARFPLSHLGRVPDQS